MKAFILLMSLAAAAPLVGCGEEAATSSAPSARTVARAPAPVKASPSPAALRAGRRTCQAMAPIKALRTFLARAKAAQAAHALPARHALIVQATQRVTNPAAPTIAAALYASTKPVAARSGAYAGCAAALSAQEKR